MTDVNYSLVSFQFETNAVRATEINGVIWFVARDVALVLGYSNPSRSVQDHCKSAKSLKDIGYTETVEANKINDLPLNTLMIQESDVLRLVVKSSKPEAEQFEKWVFEDVLPTLRKTGAYQVELLSPAELILRQAQMMVAVEQEQKRQAIALKQVEERQRITEGKIEDFANGAEHFSITAYNKLFRNKQISNSAANTDGRKLTKIAKDNGFDLGKAPHPVWGSVHTYPKAMMDAYYRGEYH